MRRSLFLFFFTYRRPPILPSFPTRRSSDLKEEKRGGTAVVVTSDRDAFQLASEQTTILQPTRGVSELARVGPAEDRKSTRLNSSHPSISYAVLCLKKKTTQKMIDRYDNEVD